MINNKEEARLFKKTFKKPFYKKPIINKREYVNNDPTADAEKKQQQQFFNKRKLKELKQEKHQELMRDQKREKIMNQLNKQATIEKLKEQAKAQGLLSPRKIDPELIRACIRYKVDFQKLFLSFFKDREELVSIKGLPLPRMKKENYLKLKPLFVKYIQKQVNKDTFAKVVKHFNHTMDTYVIKHNNERFKEYKIKIKEQKVLSLKK